MSSHTPNSDWWKLFFADTWADIIPYFKPEEVTSEEVSFITTVLDLEKGSHILDVPCGNGRLGIPLAMAGYEVTGIDFQQPLLEQATLDAEKRGAHFKTRQADMRDLPWWDEFDGALCYWSSIGYLTEEGDREFIEALWRSLKPGAPLLLETLTLETVLPTFIEKDWFRHDEWLVLEERSFDPETSRLNVEWTFVRDDVGKVRQSSVRLYAYRELLGLLRSCGFNDFVGLDAATGNPFSADASRLCLLSRKHS